MEARSFQTEHGTGTITFINRNDIVITMTFSTDMRGKKVYYWAAAPAGKGISFSGSGMPYPNAIVAYDNTVNKGIVAVDANNSITVEMKYPNAFYVGLGTLYVVPHANFKIMVNPEQPSDQDITFAVPINDGIPFRTLTYPAPPSKNPRNSPLFYQGRCHGARSQESIIYASQYPSKFETPDDFWADRPPR